jgi:hypothetical protein
MRRLIGERHDHALLELVLDDAYALDKVRDGFDGGFHFQWISHVPRSRLSAFLALFHRKLSPRARVVFGDNNDQGTDADSEGNLYQERTLPDGSRHRVIKNWLQPDELRALLAPYADVVELQHFARDWFACYRLRNCV